MVELQLHYFCCHGKRTKQKPQTFCLIILMHVILPTIWHLAFAIQRSPVFLRGKETPTTRWKNLFLYSLLWLGVHDKNNKQLITEVTLTSFVPVVWAHTSGFIQEYLSYFTRQWNPSNAHTLLVDAELKIKQVSWKYWNLTFSAYVARENLTFPSMLPERLALHEKWQCCTSGVAAALSVLDYFCLHCFRKVARLWLNGNLTSLGICFSHLTKSYYVIYIII